MSDDNFTPLLTNTQHIRLELIKLAYRHDRSPADVIAKATEIEEYVNGKPEQSGIAGGHVEPNDPI